MSFPRLGAHMSIAGGLPEAVRRARAVEATALQVFVKSANQWRARPFAEGEVEAFRAAVREAGLGEHLTAHSSYLINLASPDAILWERSLQAFVEELRRCTALGIGLLILHPGSHMGAGAEAGLERLTRALDRALDASGTEGTRVLLEITAGQGRCLGGSFEEIATVLDGVRERERVGACFDTCHALAAGYEFRDADSYAQTFARLDATIGLSRLRAFHLNDSRGALGSRLDRHAAIGRGEVGLEPFRLLLNDRRFRGLPMVIETEKGEDLAEDRENLAVLRSLVRE
jgi:deoxyribonuclease-4